MTLLNHDQLLSVSPLEVALPVVECRVNQSGLNSQLGEDSDSDVMQQSSSSILPQFEKYTIEILKQPNQSLGIKTVQKRGFVTVSNS